MKALTEMQIATKASFYLTHSLILESTKADLKEQIKSHGRKCKGKEYNTALLPFIANQWNPENAKSNSDSLHRMISRLQALNAKYS